jgi:hypothetical protein
VLTKSSQLDSVRSHKIPEHTMEQEVGPTYSAWFNTLIYLGLVLCLMQSNRTVVITLMETRSWSSYSGIKKVTNTFSTQADSSRTLPLIPKIIKSEQAKGINMTKTDERIVYLTTLSIIQRRW